MRRPTRFLIVFFLLFTALSSQIAAAQTSPAAAPALSRDPFKWRWRELPPNNDPPSTPPATEPSNAINVKGPGAALTEDGHCVTPYSDTTPYRWIDGKQRDLNGMRIEGVCLVVTRNAIRVIADQEDIVIKDSAFLLQAPTNAPDLPVAIETVGGSNILIENVVARNYLMHTPEGEYPNGDCFTGERASSNVTLRDTVAEYCTNGGYDFKTANLIFDNASARYVNFCARIWGSASATRFTCGNWSHFANGGAFQINSGAYMVIEELVISAMPEGPTTVFGLNSGSTLIVKKCTDLYLADDGQNKLVYQYPDTTPAYLELGEGCQLGLTKPESIPPLELSSTLSTYLYDLHRYVPKYVEPAPEAEEALIEMTGTPIGTYERTVTTSSSSAINKAKSLVDGISEPYWKAKAQIVYDAVLARK